jgi:hypothetical protein
MTGWASNATVPPNALLRGVNRTNALPQEGKSDARISGQAAVVRKTGRSTLVLKFGRW